MGALSDFNTAIELLKKGSTIEAQEKIMELREADLERRDEVLALLEENRILREQLDTRSALTFDGRHYWLEQGGDRAGPYCQVCQDRDAKLVHLQCRQAGAWRCGCCDGFFPDASYRDPISSTVADSDFDVFSV